MEKGAEKTLGGNGSKHVKGRSGYDKSPTSKIYTTWARILSDRNIFCTLGEGRTTAGSNAPGAFLVFYRVQVMH